MKESRGMRWERHVARMGEKRTAYGLLVGKLREGAARKAKTGVVDNTVLVKIMLTLMDYFSPADRRTPWVRD
jgi:hypothetical protein